MFTSIAFIVNLIILKLVSSEKTIVVETSMGKIRGSVLTSDNGRKFNAFRGIRYAEPPIGENRFKPAVPIKSWYDEILDATKDGNICPSEGSRYKSDMSEDCLILNVYSNNISANSPVLAYIHGGSNALGGSHSKHFVGPKHIMNKDIVLVTMNYRLGPLGFISTGTEDAPGNLGYKDQLLVLQWIKKNIQYFGGDSNSVTLAGNSAGGSAVILHMVSTLSRDLFHRAIISSGGLTSMFSTRNQYWSEKLLNDTSCNSNNKTAALDCLRTLSWEEIIGYVSSWQKYIWPPFVRWNYEVEENFEQKRFLAENPLKLYFEGKFANIPVMVGLTKDEFDFCGEYILNVKSQLDSFNEDFGRELTEYINFDDCKVNATETIHEFYLQNLNISKDNSNEFGSIFSDGLIRHGVHRFIDLVRKHNKIYFYRFDHMVFNYPGVYHGFDLMYLFYMEYYIPQQINPSYPGYLEMLQYTSWIASFMKHGDPNIEPHESVQNITWEPSNKDHKHTFYINGTSSHMGATPYRDRFDFWDELCPVEDLKNIFVLTFNSQ